MSRKMLIIFSRYKNIVHENEKYCKYRGFGICKMIFQLL